MVLRLDFLNVIAPTTCTISAFSLGIHVEIIEYIRTLKKAGLAGILILTK
jgi:hypothetical protein